MAKPKQFCLNGHDTFKVGRDKSGGRCSECRRRAERGRTPVEAQCALFYERLPIQPLVDVLAARKISYMSLGHSGARQMHRWVAKGHISVVSGDRIACDVLGMHPIEIWGPDWLDPKLTKEAAA